jgi:hypothetical protein
MAKHNQSCWKKQSTARTCNDLECPWWSSQSLNMSLPPCCSPHMSDYLQWLSKVNILESSAIWFPSSQIRPSDRYSQSCHGQRREDTSDVIEHQCVSAIQCCADIEVRWELEYSLIVVHVILETLEMNRKNVLSCGNWYNLRTPSFQFSHYSLFRLSSRSDCSTYWNRWMVSVMCANLWNISLMTEYSYQSPRRVEQHMVEAIEFCCSCDLKFHASSTRARWNRLDRHMFVLWIRFG